MAIWLDLIGSFLLGSLLVMNVVRMEAGVVARSAEGSMAWTAQSNAVTTADFMADDFRKIGLGVSGTAVTLADSSRICFLADLTGSGKVDTLSYSVGAPSEASDTPNPLDRVLYRAVDSGPPESMRMGVTDLSFSYFNAAGDSLASPVSPGEVRKIRVNLMVESPAPYDSTYAQALMQFTVWPKNLK